MEELKLLIEMVANLPAMATWVLVGFFVYKICIIGSTYGVLRFLGGRMFDWLQQRKIVTEHKDVRPVLDGLTLTGSMEPLVAQLHRIRGKGDTSRSSSYIYKDDVGWLREAIDAKIESERKGNGNT